MEAQNGEADVAQLNVGGDQNEKKRPLVSEEEHDAKRVKTGSDGANDAGLQNGVSGTESKGEVVLEVNGENRTHESETAPLGKGVAPVKAE